MKSRTSGIVKLLLSILVLFVFFFLYWKLFGLLGIHFSGIAREIVDLLRYVVSMVIIFVIYKGVIKTDKNKFNKNLLNNIIYTLSCLVFLIVITIIINKILKYFGKDIGYSFTNYFNQSFTLSFLLNLIKECIIIPFLLCIIFPLGFSEIFKKAGSTAIIAGLTFGIIYGLLNYPTFETALIYSITPAIIVMLLTYLYKTNKNIWVVIITYISYVLFGGFLINYII